MLGDGDEADLIESFALPLPLPIAVIGQIRGAPEAGMREFRKLADSVVSIQKLPAHEYHDMRGTTATGSARASSSRTA